MKTYQVTKLGQRILELPEGTTVNSSTSPNPRYLEKVETEADELREEQEANWRASEWQNILDARNDNQ